MAIEDAIKAELSIFLSIYFLRGGEYIAPVAIEDVIQAELSIFLSI